MSVKFKPFILHFIELCFFCCCPWTVSGYPELDSVLIRGLANAKMTLPCHCIVYTGVFNTYFAVLRLEGGEEKKKVL